MSIADNAVIRRQVIVNTSIEKAFAVFTDRFGDFKPKEHFDLGEGLGMMDFAAAARMSGARFVLLSGALARLERALANFMLDLHTKEHGLTEVNPPRIPRPDGSMSRKHQPSTWPGSLWASTSQPSFTRTSPTTA
mgnify:CR=1 FL=1